MSGLIALALAAALIAANGLFVAAEFSYVSLRRAQIEQLAEAGGRRAGVVRRELDELPFALSAAQLGITVSSLLVGYIAERAVGDTIVRPLLSLLGVPESAALGATLVGALLLAVVTQMVVGELLPKSLAVARPLGVALAVAPPARAFGLALGPVIRGAHRVAEWLPRVLFRAEAREAADSGHSLEELAHIISASGREGSLTAEQAELLQRAVDLGDTRVGEVMVPRPDVVWIEVDASLADLRALARSSGHSRFPVRGESGDDVRGTVHVKDLLAVERRDHEATPVSQVMASALEVPESETLRRLLGELRRAQRTFAVVVDEYGGTVGVVTLEDLLEELVGDIEDEFDRADAPIRRGGAGRFLVQGSVRVERLAQAVGCRLPEGEYETVAGFVLDRLGHIPEPGEAVEHDGWTLTVTAVDGARVTELAALAPPTPPAEGAR